VNASVHKARPGLHPQEKGVLLIVALHLVFLPWAFGTMHIWAQAFSLSLATLGLCVSLLPRTYTPEQAGGTETVVLVPWRRLKRFPLFWIGLALFLLMIVQSLNPAWRFTHDDTKWWMVGTSHVTWLPSSTDTPFGFFDLWRQFIFWTAAWMTICTIWIGVTRRKALQWIAYGLAANFLCVGAAAIAHKLDGTRKVLWLREFKGAEGFGSFVYHNHGAAYLALGVLLILALAAWHQVEARRKLARSSPGMVWLFAGLVMAAATGFSGSRAGVGLLG
jgi:hypothetical protein